MQLYRKVSVLLSMGIMGIGLITFTISTPSAAQTGTPDASVQRLSDDGGSSILSSEHPSSTPTPIPSPMPTPTPVPNDLQNAADSDIHDLIVKYLNAKLECSMESFTDIVTDTAYLDLEDIQKRTEAIREYQNIECYTKTGVGEIDYVVYFTYEMVIPTIDTPAASIDSAYIKYSSDGKPQIYLGEVSTETYEYLSSLNYDDDVQKLIQQSNEKMEEAIKQDESLGAFWEKIQNIPEGDSEG